MVSARAPPPGPHRIPRFRAPIVPEQYRCAVAGRLPPSRAGSRPSASHAAILRASGSVWSPSVLSAGSAVGRGVRADCRVGRAYSAKSVPPLPSTPRQASGILAATQTAAGRAARTSQNADRARWLRSKLRPAQTKAASSRVGLQYHRPIQGVGASRPVSAARVAERPRYFQYSR
jgi:hypothetical protein